MVCGSTNSRIHGIAFLIVHFKVHGTYFLMPYKALEPYFDGSMLRKSIPYEAFIEKGFEIKLQYEPRLDYLKAIDAYLNGF
jgi:recombination protein U